MADHIARFTILPGLLLGEIWNATAVLLAHGVSKEDSARDLILDVGVILELRESASYDGGSLARYKTLLVGSDVMK